MNILSGKEFAKKISLWVGLVLATFVFFILVMAILSLFKLGETVVVGVPMITVLYFWGGFGLIKHGWRKVVGTVVFLLAAVLNFVFIASPYDTLGEFRGTRIFLLTLFSSGIFLIMQKGKLLRLVGILVVLLTIIGALLGAFFQIPNLSLQ
ncbi:MAG: hypothetical protein PHV43_01480 [Candidatus Colwellbacteria bacterium]|nr:hypothetical protein [Candidatus Colwellbacteria bacterium]